MPHDQALVERAHDRAVGAELHEEGADDRSQDAGAADCERVDHRAVQHVRAGEEDRGQHHGGDDGHRIGLEQVGGHAGAVADIVADIVGDRGRIARIIFRNAGFDLADEVAADVGALGEDTAAETGEDRDQRSAEAERHESVDHFTVVAEISHRADQRRKVNRDTEQGEAGNQHAGDSAGLEGDIETGGQAVRRGLRRTHIGAHRNMHADETRDTRKHGADQEAQGGDARKQPPGQHEHNDADNGDRRILAGQISLRAFANRSGNLLHARIALIGGEHRAGRPDRVSHGQHAAEYDEINHRHAEYPQGCGPLEPLRGPLKLSFAAPRHAAFAAAYAKAGSKGQAGVTNPVTACTDKSI
jgi:hypothetical protein